MAGRPALAGQAIGRCRTAVFEGVTVGLEALEGQVLLLAGDRTDAVQAAPFGVHEGVDPVREQGAGDRLFGIVIPLLLFCTPQPRSGLG